MKKLCPLFVFSIFLSTILSAQNVAINADGSVGDNSAMLDVKSTTKGLLIPRMTVSQRNGITSPASGLMIYQTDSSAGFYYYDGSAWSPVGRSTNSLWSLNGNAGTDPANNFIGTVDNQPLLFRINNQGAGKISDFNTSLGLSSMQYSVDGQYNTAIGINTLSVNQSYYSTATGFNALSSNTTGSANTAFGFGSLFRNQTGSSNAALGNNTLVSNTTGDNNTAIGSTSISNNTTGQYNIGLGVGSLQNIITGSSNLALGSFADVSDPNQTNATAVGAQAFADCDNCMVLGSVQGIHQGQSNINVGIGTSHPQPSSVLDLTSTQRGLLIPRMTQAERDAIGSPSTSLLLYQTDGTPGFYFYDGATWQPIAGSSNNVWSLLGNAGTNPTTNFIGTTDNKPLTFKINNQPAGIIDGTSNNTILGAGTTADLTQGTSNSVFGSGAFLNNTSGTSNTVLGAFALRSNTEGGSNIAIGVNTLFRNTSGSDNTAVGNSSMSANIDGLNNTAIGAIALSANTSGQNNTAIGFASMNHNTTGNFNTATGESSLQSNTTGMQNVGFGRGTLGANTIGKFNTALGTSTLFTNTIGDFNTGLGYSAAVSTGSLTNATAIGANSQVGCDNCMVLGSINGINGANSNVTVGIGTAIPDASSVLDLTSTEKGFLTPRMNQSQRDAIVSPSTGLLIYQTDGTAGFYFYNGTAWATLGGSANNVWSTNGNSGTNPAANFIGTSDNQPLVFKINNEQAGKLGVLSNISFGIGSLLNVTGNFNTSYGANSLRMTTSGDENVGIGVNALNQNTTGTQNTSIGTGSLLNNTTGNSNTAAGSGTLLGNTTGFENTGFGINSLIANSTGNQNTGVGGGALAANSTGSHNTSLGDGSNVSTGNLTNATALGANALVSCSSCLVLGSISGVNNATSSVNVGIGTTAPNTSSILDLTSTSKGLLTPRMTQSQRDAIASPAAGLLIYQTDNTAGFYYYNSSTWTAVSGGASGWGLSGNSGTSSTTNFIGNTDDIPLNFRVNNQKAGLIQSLNGSNHANTAFGYQSQNTNSGFFTTSFGYQALFHNTTASWNTAFGSMALQNNTTGSNNTAIGETTLQVNTLGSNNTATGRSALSNTTTDDNTADGFQALGNNQTGANNTAIGSSSLITATTGSSNTALGAYTDVSSEDISNSIAIGYGVVVDASNKVRIGNASVTVIEGQVPFTTPSDGRFKYNVQEDVKGLDFILKLRPITYQFDAKKLDEELNPNGFKNASYGLQASYTEASLVRRTGFIAQEVEKAANQVGYNFSGVIRPSSSRDHYGLSYESFVVPLVKAVQEQEEEIQTLKAENEELKKLKAQVELLSKKIESLSANK